MNNGKSTVTIPNLNFSSLESFKNEMAYFFTNEWVHIIEKKKCYIYCIEISKYRGLKVTLSKSFPLACNLFSILLHEQCWRILTFLGILGTQSLLTTTTTSFICMTTLTHTVLQKLCLGIKITTQGNYVTLIIICHEHQNKLKYILWIIYW